MLKPTLKLRLLRALRAVAFQAALTFPALFSGLYFKLAFACLNERGRQLRLPPVSSQDPRETIPSCERGAKQ